ncbi:hypothetical protein [Streptomyces sp. V1I6]|uniref:hypothetical protein n=1 Tax=Streptomyces sp. V1I6 TaxID=3042273 RepID=UPI00278295AF|nr:hypothetical protein [Streptomyces sp. V1I6]MDQ0843672.1 hypothetical protein [Streptomyces sp. V1I6]
MTQHEERREATPEAPAPDARPEQPAEAAVSKQPEAPEAPVTVPQPEAPAPGARRRFPVKLVAAVVVLGLVAGAAGWGRSALRDADRTAPTVTWAEPAEHPELDFPPLEPTGLAAQLLPLPPFDRPGPDIDEFGNDSVVDQRRAVALFKEGSRGLPSAKRKAYDKAVEKLRIKGLAMRSYRDSGNRYVLETRLAQLENTKAVTGITAFQKEMTEAFGVFRRGPKIKGHPDAACFLLPKVKDLKLDAMMCTGHVGEVLVTMYAYGPKPLVTKSLAELVGEQLDHIASPGESV